MKNLIALLGGVFLGFLLSAASLALLAIAIDIDSAEEREKLEKLRKYG
jgi:hypothetical protein